MGDMGKDQETVEEFITHTFDPFKNETTTKSNIGTAFQAQGELDEAIQQYKKALSIQADARNHFNLAAGFRNKGLLDEAIEQFEKSLSFNQSNPEVLTSLGNALWYKGKCKRKTSAADTFKHKFHFWSNNLTSIHCKESRGARSSNI